MKPKFKRMVRALGLLGLVGGGAGIGVGYVAPEIAKWDHLWGAAAGAGLIAFLLSLL